MADPCIVRGKSLMPGDVVSFIPETWRIFEHYADDPTSSFYPLWTFMINHGNQFTADCVKQVNSNGLIGIYFKELISAFPDTQINQWFDANREFILLREHKHSTTRKTATGLRKPSASEFGSMIGR